jgi:molybdate transport system substrate-binding protein
MSTVAFKDAYLELLPAFERASGHRVLTQWVPTVDVLRRIKAGDSVDLVLMSLTGIQELAQSGRIVSAGITPFVRSAVGMAVRAGAPRPDMSSTAAFVRSLLAAKSICHSTGPSGSYIAGLFERLGIAADIKGKTLVVTGTPVGEFVASGEAEIGLQQIPELLPVPGIDYLGPLPADIQYITVFAAGTHVAAQQPAAAAEWVAYLTSASAAALYEKHGMTPA